MLKPGVHDNKVKELEAERDDLKEKTLELAKEKYTLNGALAEAQAVILGKAEQLSKANDSVKDLKLKMEVLEGMLSEVRTREGILTKSLVEERQPSSLEAMATKNC